jgi:hypothetical protein
MKIIVLFTVILALFTYNTEGQPDLKSKAISQHNFKKLLKKENAEILDVRTPEEYNAWHMENAINIDNKFFNLIRIKLTCFTVIAVEDQVKLCCLCMPMALQRFII